MAEYTLTAFSKPFFPKLAEIRPSADVRDNDPFLHSKEKGYLYQHLFMYGVDVKIPTWNFTSNRMHFDRKTYIMVLGWACGVLYDNALRTPGHDLFFEDDSPAFNEFFDGVKEKARKGECKVWNLRHIDNGPWLNKTIIQKAAIGEFPELRNPEANCLTCTTDVLKDKGFLEGCAYDGLVLQSKRGYVIAMNDEGKEHLLPAEFFLAE